jgi:hypothetical protein
MNAAEKILHRDDDKRGILYMPAIDSSAAPIADREIRYMSHSRARKAGKWTIKKYSGVFKKLARA